MKVWLVKDATVHNRAWMRPVGRQIRANRTLRNHVESITGATTARVINQRLARNDLNGLSDLLWVQTLNGNRS
jgi:hypothetical protein